MAGCGVASSGVAVIGYVAGSGVAVSGVVGQQVVG